MRADASNDDLQTRLLEIARAREGNAEAIGHVSHQLLEIRTEIRHELETPWPQAQGSAERQERLKRVSQRLLQDLNAQEELASQLGAGLALTSRLQAVVIDMGNQGLDVSDLLTHLDQLLRHEA